MKKKIILLLILVISLFIYSSRVNAMYMWMQCTNNPEDQMRGYDSGMVYDSDSSHQASYYNTIAVINAFEGGHNIRHLVYAGKDFFMGSDSSADMDSPTFIANAEGDEPKYEKKVCWYEQNGSSNFTEEQIEDMEDDCPSMSSNKFISKSKLEDGFCPEAFYDSDAINNFINDDKTTKDYVYMAGLQNAKAYEIITQPNFALYDVGNGNWVMETYSVNGVYGFAFLPSGDAATACKPFQTSTINPVRECLSTFILNINPDSNTSIMESNFAYDDEYVSYTQALQMVRIYKLRNNYFKLETYSENNKEVLLGGLGNKNISHVHLFGENNEVLWDEIYDWYDLVSNELNPLSDIDKKFPDPDKDASTIKDVDKTYYSLIKQAEDFNKKMSDGLSPDLKIKDIDSIFANLDNALSDLGEVVDPDPDNNKGFPKFVSRNNSCQVDGTTNDASRSYETFIWCSTIGKPFDEDNTYAVNFDIVEQSLFLVASKQIDILQQGNGDFANIDKITERYAISLAKFATYINNYYSDELTEKQKKTIEDLSNQYKEFVRSKYQAEIIIDCNSLLGEDVLNKIEKYVDIIKIAVPIILIAFGILDFVKAMLSGDDDKMKKAQKQFLIRVVISILFFLLPFILKLILTIANKAWSFISPTGCDIF